MLLKRIYRRECARIVGRFVMSRRGLRSLDFGECGQCYGACSRPGHRDRLCASIMRFVWRMYRSGCSAECSTTLTRPREGPAPKDTEDLCILTHPGSKSTMNICHWVEFSV